MANSKQIGKLENLIVFKTDKNTLNKVLADIKKVKDAMKAAMSPLTSARNSTKLDPALKRQREINKAHTQAIIEDRKRAANALAKIQNEELKNNKKAANDQNTLNKRNKNFDERARATQGWFGDTFGRGGQRKATALYNQLRDKQINPSEYSMKLRTLRGDLYRAQRAQRSFNQSIHDMRGAFVQATASYTAFAGVMGIANTGKAFQGYQSSMEMAFGGEQGAAPFVEYLRKEIRRLGLDVQQTTDDFSKFAIAAKGKVSDSDLKNIFTGYQQYATAAGTSKERTSLGMNAIKQMFDKDFVYSEEFRQQLSENVSGAGKAFVQAASEMLGREISTAELTDLMKAKKLPTEKLLPIVAKYWKIMSDDSLNKKLQQLAAVEARMVESWTRFVGMLYDSGVESSLSNLYKGLDRIFYSIKNLAGNALGKYLKGVLDMLSESALFVLDTFQLIFYYIDKSFGNDSNLKGFTAEMLGQVSAAIGLFFMLRKILAVMGLLKLAAMLFKNKLQEAATEDIAGGLEKQSGRFKGVGSILGKVLGAAVAWEVGTAIGEYLRNNFSVVKDFGDWMGLNLAQRFNPNSQDASGGKNAFAAMNGAGFNAAWASSMPMFMQNQQPQTAKVELTLNGELSKMVDVKIKENNTQTIQSILPMAKN